MSTIKELTYKLWMRLEGGQIPDDTRYTYRELKSYIVSGIALSLKTSYFEQRNLEDFKYGDDSISVTYTANVLQDSNTEEYYSEFTGETISIAGNRFITVSSTGKDRFSTTFVPLRHEEVFISKFQPTIPCIVPFYKENNRIKYIVRNMRDSQVKITERYSVNTNDDAQLTLPLEFENMVVSEAFKLIMPPVVADRENNGIPNN